MNWKKPILIIGGTTKAGTTSLFDWLAGHPDIGAAKIKETRYFLDEFYPLPKMEADLNSPEKYMNFFNLADIERNCTLLEATPDYMYCVTPLSIPNIYSEAKIVFILRDPVERFISWYFYAKQRVFIPSSSTLQDFWDLQTTDITQDKPSYCYALHQGIYEPFLKKFHKSYRDNLLILHFDELKNDPEAVINRICNFANLESSYFDDFNFAVSNKTVRFTNPNVAKVYSQLRLKITLSVIKYEWILAFLRFVNKPIKAALERTRTDVQKREIISDSDRVMIEEFYKENPPWRVSDPGKPVLDT